MQKKDDKEGNKIADKEERQRKIRERGERSKEIRKKNPNFGFCACEKHKKLFNYVRLVRKYAFFLAKPIFSHSYAHFSE